MKALILLLMISTALFYTVSGNPSNIPLPKLNQNYKQLLVNDTFKLFFRINEDCLERPIYNPPSSVLTLRFYEVNEFNALGKRLNVTPVFENSYSQPWDGNTPFVWPLSKFIIPQREIVIPAYVLNLPPNKRFAVEVIRTFKTSWKKPQSGFGWIPKDHCVFNENNTEQEGGTLQNEQILRFIVSRTFTSISNKATIHIGYAKY